MLTSELKFENLGTVNRNKVTIEGLELWFSYETCVAYRFNGNLYVRQNDWGPTTGKFLNRLATKSDRLESVQFESQLQDVLSRLSLNLG